MKISHPFIFKLFLTLGLILVLQENINAQIKNTDFKLKISDAKRINKIKFIPNFNPLYALE